MAVKVLVEMGEVFVVERRGLPRVGFFRGTFFGCPFPTVPSPLQIGRRFHFFNDLFVFLFRLFW